MSTIAMVLTNCNEQHNLKINIIKKQCLDLKVK